MKVIRANKTHAKYLAEILVEAYFDSKKLALKHVREKINDMSCFVAVERGVVLGLFTYLRDFSHYSNYLEDIAVKKSFRRKGVAKILLQKFIKISRKEQPRKQKYVLSSTDITNKISIKMHLNFGFKKLGLIKGLHYGKDEIIFGYSLR